MKEKIGILYYSLSGHTKKIAEEIKAVTGGGKCQVFLGNSFDCR